MAPISFSSKLSSAQVQGFVDAIRDQGAPKGDQIVTGPSPLLDERERAALEPPRAFTVSEWADEYRVLGARLGSAEPGRWRTDRTPYLREPMDAMGSRDLEMVVIVKPAQVGGSEATRNTLGRWADQDPGPCLIVYPTEKAANEQMVERIGPMFTETPRLTRLMGGFGFEITKGHINTLTMPIWAAWAGSPQALASRPCRFVILDEVDKFPPFAGKESEPVALAMARTRTFGHRKKIILISTPTTDKGLIWTYYETCLDKRHYHVPCPLCGVMQQLVWSQIRWNGFPEKVQAEVIESEGVWYECSECKGRIDEDHRDSMVEKGQWVMEPLAPEYQNLKIIRRGYHFSALIATIGIKWRDLGAKFMRVQDDPAKHMEFVTQDLGEPYRDQVKKIEDTRLSEIYKKSSPRGVVPDWASCVLMTVDSQKGWFSWLVRAWGRGERSQLVDWGEAETFKQLEDLLERKYPVGMTGHFMIPAFTLIDSGGGVMAASDQDGSRTDEVYRWAAKFPGRVMPSKGTDTSRSKVKRDVWVGKHTYRRHGFSGYEVKLVQFDANALKDVLASRINHRPEGDKPPIWALCEDIPTKYFVQMDAEHKIQIREGTKYTERWVIRSDGRRNEALDLEVLQIAACKLVGAEFAPDKKELDEERKANDKAREEFAFARQASEESGNTVMRGSGWLTRPNGQPYIYKNMRR